MSTEHRASALLSGAILPTWLEWLCQPDHMEQTVRLLVGLNQWQQASQQLLYADRQGLQDAQALVITQAVQQGTMQAVAYRDCSDQFPGELLLASAADQAARSILIHLRSLADPALWPAEQPEGDRVYQRFIRPFSRRMTGKDFPQVADALSALELSSIRACLQEHLQKLVTQATRTRQPIPLRALRQWCFAPIDLLPIRENRWYFLDDYDMWETLDRSDLRKLDPEGRSEIVFQYRSSTAVVLFHLPFRQAATFLSTERLRALPHAPAVSQEQGISQNRSFIEEERVQRSAGEILQELGFEMAKVCPHRLVNKHTYLAQPAIRDLLWPTGGHGHEEWMDDVWDGLALPPSLR